jgi:branched-chain amino acid transport system permease protein
MDFSQLSMQVLLAQLVLGLINGSFYAMLSLGLALIFGLLHIGNFAHGAQYMMGAFCAWMLLRYVGIGYWPALVVAPLIVGVIAVILERLVIRRIYKQPHMYGLLLTYGMTLIIEGAFRQGYGTSGLAYPVPSELTGGWNLGFMFLPVYRGWVILASVILCIVTWFVIERTRLGARLRAATEKPQLTRALGINVPRLVTLTYGFGVGLAGLAGVMAAPIYQVNPLMGSNLVIVVFAVVVIGGLGSIWGSIISGFGLGIAEGLTKSLYPQASTTIIFVIMAIVLLLKPGGLFGKQDAGPATDAPPAVAIPMRSRRFEPVLLLGLLLVALTAPFVFYPPFLMKVLCFALFASAFNLLVGYVGLLSFGHAAFFGMAAYVTAYSAKAWSFPPELAILAGTATSLILGTLFGWVAIRRQGVYFAMVTLALSQMVFFFVVQAPFTGSEDGIQGVPRGYLFGLINLDDPLALYFFVLAIFIAGFLIIRRTINSPFGRVLKAIRENEVRAISLGYDTDRFKLLAFILSATLAGLAGATKTLVFQLASLVDVHWSMSGMVVLMTLVGGLGTVLGPAIGALIITSMDNYLASFGSWVLIIEGFVFVACVLVFRRGVIGEAAAVFQRLSQRNASSRFEQKLATTQVHT